MKKVFLTCALLVAGQAFATEVVLEKNGVTLTDDEMLIAAGDLSDNEMDAMRETNEMLRTFIEQQFDNKVMLAGISEQLKADKDYAVLSDMAAAKFANKYYVRKEALKKIDAVKDFKTLAKQTYQSELDKYKGPETFDFYHVLFIKQDGTDSKAKADALLADINAGKTTLAEAAKKYHTPVAGVGEDGILKNVVPDRMMKPIQEVALGMKVGDVSKVIETDIGYHIIGLKQKNEAKTMPYDDKLEEKIIANLKTKMYRSTNKEIRDQYRGPEGLTVNEDLLKSVTEQILKPKK